jgi:hypothetical protein
MTKYSLKRTTPQKEIETRLLITSKRRCCLCYFLDNITEVQKGQVCHLDQNPNNSRLTNLVWLCLKHHDEFDSKTRQSKGITVGEIREYRNQLYKILGTQDIPIPKPILTNSRSSIGEISAESYPRSSNIVTPQVKMHKPWKIKLLAYENPKLFAYKSPNRFDGVCRIEQINLPDKRKVIICEQIDENPGMSITNAVEYITSQICEQLDIDPKKLVLIQHYNTWYLQEKEWTLVTFGKTPPESGFKDPEWKTMTERDWHSLGFHPRKQSSKRREEPPSLIEWYSNTRKSLHK